MAAVSSQVQPGEALLMDSLTGQLPATQSAQYREGQTGLGRQTSLTFVFFTSNVEGIILAHTHTLKQKLHTYTKTKTTHIH